MSSVELNTVRLSVPHGMPIPSILVRDGKRYEVVETTHRTVGHVMESHPLRADLFPFAAIELFDEHTILVKEITKVSE